MSREWYYQVMGEELGPLSVAELKDKAEHRLIQLDTLIRKGKSGEWVTAARVKGLFPEATPVPKPAASGSGMHAAKPAAQPDTTPAAGHAVVSAAPPSPAAPAMPSRTVHVATQPLSSTDLPSVDFYEFVGFREAITPALHDAVRAFITAQGLTMVQANRKALAEFIGRPELGTDAPPAATEAVAPA